MNHGRDLLEALRDANPIPDAQRRYADSDEAHALDLLVRERTHDTAAPTRVEPPQRTTPARVPRHRRRAVLAFGSTALITIVLIGVVASIRSGDAGVDAAASQLVLEEMPSSPEMNVVREMWTDEDGRAIASGDTGTFASFDGLSWEAIDPASVARDGLSREAIEPAWVDPGRVEWSAEDLPQEIETHPAITLLYRVEDAVEGPPGIVVYGHAQSTVGAAAVEAAYPELGEVIDVSRINPCDSQGEPLECELANEDALWVLTAADPAPDAWQAVSLSGMGLTREDVWRAYRVIWFSEDGTAFEPVVQRVLVAPGPREIEGMAATENGFVMLDNGLWTSTDGRMWRLQTAPPYEVTSLFNSGLRVLGGTGRDQIVEYHRDGSWTLVADPASLQGSDFSHVGVEAIGAGAFAAVGYEDVVFPEIEPQEPLTAASMIAVSVDGVTWRATSLEDAFGATGSVEVAIAGDRLVIAFSPDIPDDDSAGFESVPQPQWRVADIGS